MFQSMGTHIMSYKQSLNLSSVLGCLGVVDIQVGSKTFALRGFGVPKCKSCVNTAFSEIISISYNRSKKETLAQKKPFGDYGRCMQ